MPTGPQQPSGSKTGLIIAIVAVLALVAGGVGVWYFVFRNADVEKSTDTAGTGPTTSPSATATPTETAQKKEKGGIGGGSRNVTKLPEICEKIDLPPEAKGTTPDHDRFSDTNTACEWETLTVQKARSLDVDLEAMESSDDAVKRLRQNMADAADPKQSAGFHREPRPVRVDGSPQAYSDQSFNLIRKGPSEDTAKAYDMGGSDVVAVWGNVLITVSWQGSDYPPSAAGEDKLVGKQFTREKAESEAKAVAEQVIELLEQGS